MQGPELLRWSNRLLFKKQNPQSPLGSQLKNSSLVFCYFSKGLEWTPLLLFLSLLQTCSHSNLNRIQGSSPSPPPNVKCSPHSSINSTAWTPTDERGRSKESVPRGQRDILWVLSFPNKHLLSRVDKCRLLGDLISETNQRVSVSDFISLFVVHTQIVLSKERICCLVLKRFLSAVIFVVVVELLSCVWLFATPWTAARRAPLSCTLSQSLLKCMSIELVMRPTILSSVPLCSFFPQSFPASRSFPMSQFFASSGQSIGVSALALALPMNIQGWFPLGLNSLISLPSKELSRVFSNTTVEKHQFFGAQPSLWSNSHIYTWLPEKP